MLERLMGNLVLERFNIEVPVRPFQTRPNRIIAGELDIGRIRHSAWLTKWIMSNPWQGSDGT
ncbi:hypothetical protein KL908_004439, partial [Ogataea polymorpha]